MGIAQKYGDTNCVNIKLADALGIKNIFANIDRIKYLPNNLLLLYRPDKFDKNKPTANVNIIKYIIPPSKYVSNKNDDPLP